MEEWVGLQRDIPLQWHEVVAIVRDVAEAVAGGQLRQVPAAAALALDASGAVHVLQPGGAANGRAVDPGELVGGLRRLLGELLPPAGTPQELQRLATDDPDATSSVEEFCRALAFFERPSRQKDLVAHAARLREVQEQHRLEAELESLTRKTRTELPRPSSPEPEVEKRAATRSRIRPALMLAAAAAITVLVAAGLLIARATAGGVPSGAGSSAAGVATKEARTLLQKVRETASSMFGSSSSPAAPETTEQGTPTTEKDNRTRPARSPKTVSAGAVFQQPSVRIQAERPPGVPAPQPYVTVWDAPIGGPITEDIFDRRDHDVVPAMLLRPHLPTVTLTDAAQRRLSVLEAVISADGQVEQVRLVRTTPDRRYYDLMILAAVKAWVFQPASRNGLPVRYRVRIPLT